MRPTSTTTLETHRSPKEGSGSGRRTALRRAIPIEPELDHREVNRREKGALEERPRYPIIERHDGDDLAGVLRMYEQMGLVQPYMSPGLHPISQALANGWDKLHRGKPSVGTTMISRGSKGAATGTVAFVRAWDTAWVVQLFGVLPSADPGTATALQLACLKAVMTRASALYTCFFVRAENAQMNVYFDRFFTDARNADVAARVDLARWVLPREGPRSGTGRGAVALERVTTKHARLVARIAKRALGTMTADALSLTPSLLAMRRTSRSFGRVGLERRRKTYAFPSCDRPELLLLEEQTSPGVCLPGMLDAWWILPVHDSVDPRVIELAAAEIARLPKADPPKLLLLPRSLPQEPLATAGYSKITDAYLYSMNRAGVRRYYANLAGRYFALVSAMERRRARTAGSDCQEAAESSLSSATTRCSS